jgi:DNA-binding MarR family transcriptional regulator
MRQFPVEALALDLEVLRQFRIIFKSVRRHFLSIEQAIGVSGSQLWAASTIDEHPGIRVTDLAKAMSVHQTTTSNLVEKLVELGFVTRQRSPIDNRAVQLFITDLGKEKLKGAPGPVSGLLPDALGKLPYSTLVCMHSNLGVLLAQMGSLEPSGKDTPLADI